MKKPAFLILTLAIPVSIFLFLKIFGTNTFEVPFLFEDGIPECANSMSPHRVPDITFLDDHEKSTQLNEIQGYVVFGVLHHKDPKRIEEQLVELVRIQDAFFEIGSPYFILFTEGDSSDLMDLRVRCDAAGLGGANSCIAVMEKQDFDPFLRCGIALKNRRDDQLNNLVLVDPQKRIRGVYHGLDVEETDKLILELKILKKGV